MDKRRPEDRNKYRLRTKLIHGAIPSNHWEYNHLIVPPLSASAAYRLDSVKRGAEGFARFGQDEASREPPIFVYDRLDEPTRGMLEENLAFAENGDMAVCFATGMAAISAALAVTTCYGDEVIAHHMLYGCTYSLLANWLPRSGIATKLIDLGDAGNLDQAISDRTRVVYLETPVNPTLELIDIKDVRRRIDRINVTREENKKVVLIVDNTFATPFCQRPLQLGADLVVQSLTKSIGGFGADMGGAVVGAERFRQSLLMYRKDFGGVLSPRCAWPILVYGLPTLAIRMQNQQKSALKIATFLEGHPRVDRVIYPGLESFSQYALAKEQMVSHNGVFAPGSVLYFVLKGDPEEASLAAESFLDDIARNASCITLAVSLGQIRTLIEEPFSMTHSAMPDELKCSTGMAPGGIRLSAGLEDWHDIIEELGAALDRLPDRVQSSNCESEYK